MELGIFQETKLAKRIYTREYSDYKVVDTEAPITHDGGVAVFYRVSEYFSVEVLLTYGVNVVSFQLASGDRRWYIVKCYLDPEDAYTTEDAVEAIVKKPQVVRVAGGHQFQHQPIRTRGLVAGQGDYSSPGGGGPGGHERPLPPTAQAVVEGRPYTGHAPGRPVGALPA